MNPFRRIAPAVLTFILLPFCAEGQVKVEGTSVNRYSPVTELFCSSPDDPDSVRVARPELFDTGDTTVFHIARGAEIYNAVEHPGLDMLWGKIYNMNNTGIYSIMIVESVIDSLIAFTAALPPLISPAKPQTGQLIRIETADRLIIDSPLTCQAWDPVTGTGGLLALIANQSITLASTIDVTGKGFLGGQPSTEDFAGDCISVTGEYYGISAADSAGMKGEGIIYPGFPFPLGTGPVGNGGGGGNGRFAGGGGGGNYGLGGTGGKESAICTPLTNTGGQSNYINPGYFNNIGGFKNRLYLGGGGGSSTQDLPDYRATAGGNGGGIILLLTDSLICTGSDTIRANGQSVSDTATAGAGGGGGGGFIVLDAPVITGSLHLEVRGGNGGHTNDTVITGPGGFGGAGLIWYRQDSLPDNVSTDTVNGDPGIHVPTGYHYGATTSSASRNGTIMGGLTSPLKGFLFNHVITHQSVCSDQWDTPVKASCPKGGDGDYGYLWEISPDQSAWDTAPGACYEKDYLPDVSASGKYFRRIVSSGGITDTSRIILFNHYPAIMNNLVEGQATYCAGEEPAGLVQSGQAVQGGSGEYSFLWQQKTGQEQWVIAGGNTGQDDYSPPPLYETTLFRRIVQSETCLDTGNTVEITINRPPVIIRQPENDTVEFGDQATFTMQAEGTQPLSLQWYFEDSPLSGETGESLVIADATGQDQGEYFILISNACGETESHAASLAVTYPQAVKDYSCDGDLRLYPNPASDLLYIDHPRARDMELTLYDLTGSRIRSFNGVGTINVSGLPPGIYLLEVKDPEQYRARIVRLEISR